MGTGLIAVMDRAQAARRAGRLAEAREQLQAAAQTALAAALNQPAASIDEIRRCLRCAQAAIRALGGLDDSIDDWSLDRQSTDALPRPSPDVVVGFWHIATIGPWHEIVTEQLTRLKHSGLFAESKQLYVGIVGPAADTVQFDDERIRVLYRSADSGQFEFPTLDQLWEFCQQQDADVYYFHTKGVSRDSPMVEQWRHYLEHFVLDRRQECRDCLQRYDVAGVNWQRLPWPHFSGNFWWARSQYVRSLPRPSPTADGSDPRCQAEQWLGRGDPAVGCLFQSGRNHYDEWFPLTEYRDCFGEPSEAAVVDEQLPRNGWSAALDCLSQRLDAALPISVVVHLEAQPDLVDALAEKFSRALHYMADRTMDAEARAEPDVGSATGGSTHPRRRELPLTPDAAARFCYPIDVLCLSAAHATSAAAAAWISNVRPGGCVLVYGADEQLREFDSFYENWPGGKQWVAAEPGLVALVAPSSRGDPAGDAETAPLLSVLIPTLPSRKELFGQLVSALHEQIRRSRLEGEVEILAFLDNKQRSVGSKRNALLDRAQGAFVVFIDDDDEVHDEYLSLVCAVCRAHPDIDCIGFTGELATAGRAAEPTIYSLQYLESQDIGAEPGYRVFLRPPQHVSPMRREIAIQFPFPDLNCGEDFQRAQALASAGALAREFFISERVMYRYRFDPRGTETQHTVLAEDLDMRALVAGAIAP